MSKEPEQEPAAGNPEKLLDLKITHPKDWAAGISAVGDMKKTSLAYHLTSHPF
jgi:hypothetical protein